MQITPLALFDRFFPSVGGKIGVTVAAVLLLVGVGFTLLADRTGNLMLDRQVEQRATLVAEFMQTIIEHEMLEGNPQHAREALQQAVATSYVRGAFIADNEGNVCFGTLAGDAGERQPVESYLNSGGTRGMLRRSSVENGKEYEYVLVPVRKRAACFACHPDRGAVQGFVGLQISRDDLRAAASVHRRSNMFMAAGAFLVLGGMLYWLLSLTVIRPLRRLHAHVAAVRREVPRLERGTPMMLAHLAVPPTRDEIAGLGREFNGLVDQLNEANARLLRLHVERMEHAERLSSAGQMAASVAHEIRNPVAGVRGALEVFAADLPEADERREIIMEMRLQLDRVNRAINDLLAYARPTPPRFAEVSVREIVERTTGLFAQQLKGKEIDLQREILLDGETVLADGTQVQQVLWNLLLNAQQAMPQGGRLTVRASCGERAAEIRIEDTGTGIAPDVLGKVFDPFFTTKHKGTGLGMTISRRFIEQHGGSIQLESTPGAGTAAVVRLPLLNRPAEGACAARS